MCGYSPATMAPHILLTAAKKGGAMFNVVSEAAL